MRLAAYIASDGLHLETKDYRTGKNESASEPFPIFGDYKYESFHKEVLLMNKNEIVEYVGILFRAALCKCGNIADYPAPAILISVREA